MGEERKLVSRDPGKGCIPESYVDLEGLRTREILSLTAPFHRIAQ